MLVPRTQNRSSISGHPLHCPFEHQKAQFIKERTKAVEDYDGVLRSSSDFRSLARHRLFKVSPPRLTAPSPSKVRLAARDGIMSREATQKSGVPQIIKSDVALKLAEQWVNNMSKAAEDEQTEAESEARPSRLGLGAKISRQMRPGPSNDPVERKLYANLQSGKRKAAKDAEESGLTARDQGGDGDTDDELESRASAFAKKRVLMPPVFSTMKKKRK